MTTEPNRTAKEKYLEHVLKHQKKYLISIAVIVLIIPLLLNLLQNQPFLQGGESYYHLSTIQSKSLENAPLHGPLFFLGKLPLQAVPLFPIAIAIGALLSFLTLAKQLKIQPTITLTFTLFAIVSPSFIYTFTTLSLAGIFIFLFLMGLVLITHPQKRSAMFAAIPLLLASSIDIFSNILMLSVLLLLENAKKERKKPIQIALWAIVLGTIINKVFFELPFIAGPFHSNSLITDIISDFGGLSGISFFMVLLAVIGAGVVWKQKKLQHTYLFLPLVIPAYVYNPGTLFLASLVISFFAAIGFTNLFEKKWELNIVRNFTCLLIVLGILFSTASYLDRSLDLSPTQQEAEALEWISENTREESIIFSDPENSYYLLYFGQREAVYYPHTRNQVKKEASEQIMDALYIKDLFPLLEEFEIHYLFITPKMRSMLPADQKLLFLLKNERFKLIYSEKGVEVWEFREVSKT